MLAFLLYCNGIRLLGARASHTYKAPTPIRLPSLAVTNSIITLMRSCANDLSAGLA